MQILISASMASRVQKLPKEALLYRAKKKIDVEDDKHVISIRRGQSFYLYSKTEFFLFYLDDETGAYYKMKLTRSKFQTLQKEHTLAQPTLSIPKQSLRANKQSLQAKFKDTMQRHRQRMEEYRQDTLSSTRNLDPKTVVAVSRIKASVLRILDVAEEYHSAGVYAHPQLIPFLRDIHSLIKGLTDSAEPYYDRAIKFVKQAGEIEKLYNVDLDGNPIKDIQNRGESAKILKFSGKPTSTERPKMVGTVIQFPGRSK